jgi:hypothetical protein
MSGLNSALGAGAFGDADGALKFASFAASGFVSGAAGTPVSGSASIYSTVLGTPNTTAPVLVFRGEVIGANAFGDVGGAATATPRVAVASGFTSSAIGLAVVPLYAKGIYSTVFGTPSTPVPTTTVGAGFTGTVFGTPSFGQLVSPSGFSSTAVSAPNALYAQFCSGTGIASTSVGSPYSVVQPVVLRDGLAIAEGFSGTALGTANSPSTLTADATGISSTFFSDPISFFTGPSTVFGTPTVSVPCIATGFTSTVFGTLFSPCIVQASSPSTTFGLPVALGPYSQTAVASTHFGRPIAHIKGYKASAIPPGRRFGRPSASNRFNYPATGFASGAFGTASSAIGHRATSVPPTALFGTGTLVRAPLC